MLKRDLAKIQNLYVSSTPVLALLDYTYGFQKKDGSDIYAGNIHFQEVTITTDPNKNRLWHFRWGGEIVADKFNTVFEFNPETTLPIGDENVTITKINFNSAFYDGQQEYIQGHITVNNVSIDISYLKKVADFEWDAANATFTLKFNLTNWDPNWKTLLNWVDVPKNFDPTTYKDESGTLLAPNGANSIHTEFSIRDAVTCNCASGYCNIQPYITGGYFTGQVLVSGTSYTLTLADSTTKYTIYNDDTNKVSVIFYTTGYNHINLNIGSGSTCTSFPLLFYFSEGSSGKSNNVDGIWLTVNNNSSNNISVSINWQYNNTSIEGTLVSSISGNSSSTYYSKNSRSFAKSSNSSTFSSSNQITGSSSITSLSTGKLYCYTTNNTFTFTAGTSITYYYCLVGGGGGGACTTKSSSYVGYGGGGGSVVTGSFQPISASTVTIVIGRGGYGNNNGYDNNNVGYGGTGTSSTITYTATNGSSTTITAATGSAGVYGSNSGQTLTAPTGGTKFYPYSPSIYLASGGGYSTIEYGQRAYYTPGSNALYANYSTGGYGSGSYSGTCQGGSGTLGGGGGAGLKSQGGGNGCLFIYYGSIS